MLASDLISIWQRSRFLFRYVKAIFKKSDKEKNIVIFMKGIGIKWNAENFEGT